MIDCQQRTMAAARIDWRWRKLFTIVNIGLLNDEEAKRASARILRAKLRIDLKYEQEKEKDYAQD